jgi:hypothetical protein
MPVNQSQFGLLKAANSALPNTTSPTISRIERSTVIFNLPSQYIVNETLKRVVVARTTNQLRLRSGAGRVHCVRKPKGGVMKYESVTFESSQFLNLGSET